MFLVLEPSKIIFLISKNYTPKGGYNLTLYWVPYIIYPHIKYYPCLDVGFKAEAWLRAQDLKEAARV